MSRYEIIKHLNFQIVGLTALRADYDASAKACTNSDMAAHLREQAARITGQIAMAQSKIRAISY